MNIEAAAALAALAGGVAYAVKRPVSLRRLPPMPGRGTCETHDGKRSLVLPMKADENSIFLIDLGVEDEEGNIQWVKVAVDTGSESLMIAASGCRGCEEGRHLGVIKNDGTSLHRSTVRYGSQKDTVEWKRKTIRLPSWASTCDEFDADGALTHAVQCVVGDIKVGVVQERSGTSDYNILGLGSQTRNGPPAVLSSLFPDARVRAFLVEVHSEKEARLILHQPHMRCREPRFKFDVRPKHFGHGHHYLVDVQKVALYADGPIGGDNTGSEVEGDYHVLFDTGANAMSLPPKIYERIFSLPTSRGKLSITLKSQSGHDVVLDFDFDRANRQNAQVLKSHSDSLLIIGVTFLVSHALGFEDHGSHRVFTLDFL
jgi:predicted aspartyl protease